MAAKKLHLKSSVFWVITLCSPLNVSRRFGVTYRLCLQGRVVNQTRNQHEAGSKLALFACFIETM
jgi:hypothetical protein